MKKSVGEKIFNATNIVLLILFAFTCLFPFINMAAISFSSSNAILSGKVLIFPVGFHTTSYKAVLSDAAMVHSLFFTVYLTVTYTVIAMIMTILAAYPLSKKRLRGRNSILLFITCTMYFSGGMIPIYLLINELRLINTIWALILPGAVSTFNMLIMKTFFTSIPDSLEESAVMDGANDYVVLFRIILPLSMPIIATLSLFYAVGRWNGFADALFYINDPKLYPLQLKLRQIVSLNMVDQMRNDLQTEKEMVIPESLKAASLIFATVPILLVYPWLQKYFVKGVMIGSIKG